MLEHNSHNSGIISKDIRQRMKTMVFVLNDHRVPWSKKIGISGGKKSSRTGKSQRATTQVNKWNKDNPSRNFDSEILEDIPAGKNARNIALEREKHYAEKYRTELETKYHKRP